MSTDNNGPMVPLRDVGRPMNRTTILDPVEMGITPDFTRVIGAALSINDSLPNLVPYEPTALLLDINNLFRRAADNNFRIDYVRLRSIFEQRCDLRYCAAFSAVDRQDPKSNRWVAYMQDKGYHMITKDLKRYTNRKGDVVSKGNMDIEIAIAAMKLSQSFAHVIIGTCDGDFVPLIETLRDGHFRKVSVLGITNEDWTGMSDTLVRAADNFYDMTSIRTHIEYNGPRND